MKIGPAQELLKKPIKVLHLGIRDLVEGMLAEPESAARCQIGSFIPPARGDADLVEALSRLMDPATQKQITRDNELVLHRLTHSTPCLMGMKTAREVIPGMEADLFLHGGPPIEWNQMTAPMQNSAIAGAIFEGLATTPEEAISKFDKGTIRFEPAQNHQAACPFSTVITPSMPVWVVEETANGTGPTRQPNQPAQAAFAPVCYLSNKSFNLIKAAPAGDSKLITTVVKRLNFVKETILTVLGKGLDQHTSDYGPINLAEVTAQALIMGDELHYQQTAAYLIFLKSITPSLVQSHSNRNHLYRTLHHLSSSNRCFIGLSTAMAKCMLNGAFSHTPSSTMISALGSNGREFGIQVGALPGEWFTVSTEDFPLGGDNFLLEGVGLGAFAMVASPILTEAMRLYDNETEIMIEEMSRITAGFHDHWQVYSAGRLRGVPMGIDVTKVTELNLVPRLLHPATKQTGGYMRRQAAPTRTKPGPAWAQKTSQLIYPPSLKMLPWECIKNSLLALNRKITG